MILKFNYIYLLLPSDEWYLDENTELFCYTTSISLETFLMLVLGE